MTANQPQHNKNTYNDYHVFNTTRQDWSITTYCKNSKPLWRKNQRREQSAWNRSNLTWRKEKSMLQGKYSTTLAASSDASCFSCAQGKYSITLPAISETSCLDCVQGKYSTTLAASSDESCISCGQGKYSVTLPAISDETHICTQETITHM